MSVSGDNLEDYIFDIGERMPPILSVLYFSFLMVLLTFGFFVGFMCIISLIIFPINQFITEVPIYYFIQVGSVIGIISGFLNTFFMYIKA